VDNDGEIGMVKISEFIKGGNYKDETSTDTQIALRHPNKSVELYCPADYSSVTFSIDYYYIYSGVAWLSLNKGPGSEIGRADAEKRVGYGLPKNKSEDVTLTPTSQTVTIKIDEGAINTNTLTGGGLEVWKDMNVDIILGKVLDKDGKDVTPKPDPVVSTAWTDLQKWFKDNQWTVIGLMALTGLLVVTYMVFRVKAGPPVQQVQAAPAPTVVVVPK